MPGVDSRAQCPCGEDSIFNQCCGPIIDGTTPALTAEALMRSRYTAYVLGDTDYLLATWDPQTRPANIDHDTGQRWLGLRILSTAAGTAQDDTGEVEFVARFKVAGRGTRLHEISLFRKADGRWLYVKGIRGSTDSSLRH